MFKHADAHFVQVSEESVEDGNQVARGDLRAEDECQLVDGEGKRPSHLPLHVARQRVVQLVQTVPVVATEREGDGGEAVRAVLGDLSVNRLRSRWVGHAEVVVEQCLRYHVLREERPLTGGVKKGEFPTSFHISQSIYES